jgi:hypothetical protein
MFAEGDDHDELQRWLRQQDGERSARRHSTANCFTTASNTNLEQMTQQFVIREKKTKSRPIMRNKIKFKHGFLNRTVQKVVLRSILNRACRGPSLPSTMTEQ